MPALLPDLLESCFDRDPPSEVKKEDLTGEPVIEGRLITEETGGTMAADDATGMIPDPTVGPLTTCFI